MPLDGVPFSVATALLAVGVLLLAGFVKGTLGFGVGLVSATLLVQLFPAKPTLVVLVLPIGLSEAGLLVTTGIPWGLIRDNAAFYLLLVPGAVVGVLGLLVVPVDALYVALSLYIVTFLVLHGRESRERSSATERGYGAVSGVAGGFLGGSFGAAGPAVVPYLYSATRDHPRSAFVGGLGAAYIVPQVVRLPLFVAAGRLDPPMLALSGAAAVVVLAGLGLGSRLRARIPAAKFQVFVKGVLLVVAVQLAVDALVY